MSLQIQTAPQPTSNGDAQVITLKGEVSVYTSPQVKAEIVRLLAAGLPRMAVDLTDVNYMDSTGLAVLLGGLKKAREQDGDLKLVCDNINILRIFEITGLTKIFDCYRHPSDALKRL